MKDQLQTIRAALYDWEQRDQALTALSELEAMAGEPVAWMVTTELQDGTRSTYPLSGRYKDVRDACDFGEPVPLFAAPAAQQPQKPEMTPAFRTSYAYTVGFQDGKAEALAQQPQAEAVPMFWVRLRSDGMYEGPIHNAQIERVRVQSGAWSPLYLGAAPSTQKKCTCGQWEACHICANTNPSQQQSEAMPPGFVLVPVDVLKAASESLGSFVSDQGWTTLDMQAMDNIDAILAQQKGGV